MSDTFYSKLGIFIIILGAIGAIGIISAFDWETWNDIKDYPATYADELVFLKPQLTSMWTTAITSFIGCLAIGSVLMALGKIVEQQESNVEYLKMLYQLEKKNETSK